MGSSLVEGEPGLGSGLGLGSVLGSVLVVLPMRLVVYSLGASPVWFVTPVRVRVRVRVRVKGQG